MKLFINGKIMTLDLNNSIFEAMAVEDGLIKALGTTNDILKLNKDDTIIYDLAGKSVLPAFNDSHMHLLEYAFTLSRVDLSKAKSIQDIIDYMKAYIEQYAIPEGTLVEGYGWNQDYFIGESKFPTRDDLDRISKTHPIIITRACVHACVVNSRVLEIEGIDSKTQQVEGGVFEIKDNRCNGIFRENAMSIIKKVYPPVTKEVIKENILKAQPFLIQQGIVSVQTDDFGCVENYEDVIQCFRELDMEGKLKIRIYEQCLLKTKENLIDYLQKGYHKKKGTSHFKLGPLKILGDGSLGARTALLRNPYKDAPDTQGIAIYEKDYLLEYMRLAHDSGMQIAIHAIGDQMMELALDCFHQITNDNPRQNHRHGIVHCQITDKELLDKFRTWHILAYVQPIFLHYDLHIVADRVGEELASTSYNFKTLYDNGVITAIGSDCPVEPFHTMNNLYCAVNRKDLEGYPKEGFYPEQKLSILEALRGYTNYGAYASFEEEKKGSLEVGKYADMIILNEDILSIDPMSIRYVKILKTYIDGIEFIN